jgi:hypothetical protein
LPDDGTKLFLARGLDDPNHVESLEQIKVYAHAIPEPLGGRAKRYLEKTINRSTSSGKSLAGADEQNFDRTSFSSGMSGEPLREPAARRPNPARQTKCTFERFQGTKSRLAAIITGLLGMQGQCIE